MHKTLFKQLDLLQKKFERLYGKGEVFFAKAPARINIIGEHIDYIKYFKTAVLPFASNEYYLLLAFRKRNDQKVRCQTLNPGFEKTEFFLNDFKEKSDCWEKCLERIGSIKPCWANYIKASCFYLTFLYPQKSFKGMDLLVYSTIPIAGGASSSSALVVASALAIRKVNGIKIDKNEIAEMSSKAEWFCGTRGGKMDHTAMCFGSLNKALLINFHPFKVKQIALNKGYSWATFYTTKADKSNELTAQYNERSAVSRLIIPALLKKDGLKLPLKLNAKTIKKTLVKLPQAITLRSFEKNFPLGFKKLKATYPVLIQTRAKNFALPVKKYATHHLGEIKRTVLAAKLLKSGASEAMLKLGKLLKETHKSLRDFYQVSSQEIEQAFKIANQSKGVLGARVMGGGFGGNLLVLVKTENVEGLIDRMKEKYYFLKKRKNCAKDIMVSTSGKGAELLDEKTDLKLKLSSKVNNWLNWDEKTIFSLAGKIKPQKRKVKVIVVAAGKGTRAKKSGLLCPKVLAPLKGKPTLIRVLEKFSCKKLNDRIIFCKKVIVVVNPENEKEIKKALIKRQNVEYILQKKAQGTGDAVFRVMEKLKRFEGDVAVIWGKQALVQKETIEKTIALHQALKAAMSFPTTKKKNPYAPLLRDKDGWVKDSQETHLENAKKLKQGEDNIGFFVLDSKALCSSLKEIRNKIYRQGKYLAPKGEFGFPNLMARHLALKGEAVFAFCLAKNFEAKGINEKKDIKAMERYL